MTMMMIRLLAVLAFLLVSVEAFVPRAAFRPQTSISTPFIKESDCFGQGLSLVELFACRTNAKKEKRKRNRENMRKFKTTGKRGTSRRKILKRALASSARQEEAEFITRCFSTVPAPNSEDAAGDGKN